MEELEGLADGDEYVRGPSGSDYFDDFYSLIHDEEVWAWRELSSYTPQEVALLEEVLRMVSRADEAIPHQFSRDELIASGWPTRVQPVAQAALDVMQARGRFREDVEEAQPSGQPAPDVPHRLALFSARVLEGWRQLWRTSK